MLNHRNVVIPAGLHVQLKAIAKHEGRLLQVLVEQLLVEALRKRGYKTTVAKSAA
jgi:hypothetical protein